jgi:hypothetical protein
VLDWIQSTDYATWVRESWGWPFALTFHAFGNAMVVGLFFIIAMRLFGLFRTIPITSLNRLFPVIWLGFAIQVFSGTTLWVSKPARYLADGMFEWKLFFVFAGLFITLRFQKLLKQEGGRWQSNNHVPSSALRFTAITAMAWAAVLVVGRLTAYLGQLYHA